jgi:putative colanic acid biosynthesis acetyltransferase WcaF
LRRFGATIGQGARIKPGVRVKLPWRLTIGDHCWIGENTWFDNLAPITIADHVCISQDVYLCTGNHDWSDPNFKLITRSIHIEKGSWLGS